MIKITRSASPAQLTPKLKSDLTAEFIANGTSVWDLDFLKTALMEMSHYKCCYCECKLDEEAKYMEVEHFHHKDKYKSEVLSWDNLLPACKRCNSAKGTHDTVSEPIIDPSKDNPLDHLKFWNFRIKGANTKGSTTISVVNLNDQDRLVRKRFEIGSSVDQKIEDFNDLLDEYIGGTQTSTRRKNRITNGLKALLKEALPSAEYASTVATVLKFSQDFGRLKKGMISELLWDDELVQLETLALACSMDLHQNA